MSEIRFEQSPISGIKCDVTNCYYNRDTRKCYAEAIKVGPQHANTTDDTICVTFRPGGTDGTHGQPAF